MGGLTKFNNVSIKLAYGEDSTAIKDKRVAAVQALSGTGACRLFAEFQKRFHPNAQVRKIQFVLSKNTGVNPHCWIPSSGLHSSSNLGKVLFPASLFN
jgi:aspartate/tyrosine/aromatic aminotransferase